MKKIICSVMVYACISIGTSSLYADETKPAAQTPQDPMMEAWMKFATPGEHHKVLDVLVGKWNHTVQWWMSPDAPAEVSHGVTENKWIMDGRYIQQSVTGISMGQPFEGRGILGYDNGRGEYVSFWIDNMGTGFMIGTAQYDTATKTTSEKGSYTDPMTGKVQSYRASWKSIDENHSIYEMYMNGPDGKEFKCMEITYMRA